MKTSDIAVCARSYALAAMRGSDESRADNNTLAELAWLTVKRKAREARR